MASAHVLHQVLHQAQSIAWIEPAPLHDGLLEEISLRVQKMVSHRSAGIIGGSFTQHVADRAMMGDCTTPLLGRDGCEAQSLPITRGSCLVERGDQADENVVSRRFGDGKMKCTVPLYPILIVLDLGRASHAGLNVHKIGFTGFDCCDRGH